MILADVMDEIATRLRTIPALAGRTFAYPPGSVRPPAAVVSYPENYEYGYTGARGADRIRPLPVVIVVGKPTDRGARDALSDYVDGAGAKSVKAVLESGTYTALHVVTVERVEFDTITIGQTDYLAAMFDLDIVGPGG